jgi:uncharacterized lipoprotein YehR (DUF1307 family)
MKKLVLVVLLLSVVSLVGCGQKEKTISLTGPGGQTAAVKIK